LIYDPPTSVHVPSLTLAHSTVVVEIETETDRVGDRGGHGSGDGDGAGDGDGDVRVVTLDRPGRRNALTPAALDALESAVTEAEAPVVAVRGAGSAFCAGADLDAVAGLTDREAAERFAARGQRVARAIETCEAVVVAEVDGPARGGGVELALACDLRIATPAASFAESGVELGLFGAWGGTVRLPAVVGPSDAMDLALSGRVVDAREARRMGLVSRVVDDPRAVAREVAANDAAALATLKPLLRDDAGRETRERREREAFADLWAEFER
jgi:enoyl-CoA hydratase/carnithine racemase